MKRSIIFIIVAQLIFVGNSLAQAGPQAQAGELDWAFPPLQVLIDSALVTSPLMKLASTNIQMGKYELTDIHRNWMQKLNFAADARYGSMVDYSRIMQESGSSFIPPSANKYMLNYGVGISAYVPFSDIFDRKRQVQKAQLTIEQAEIQKENVEQTIKQLVITAYYDLMFLQKSLKIQTEMLSSANMLYEQKKLDFTENRVDMAEYTKAYETYLTAQNEHEQKKNDFLKAIRLMEELVGIKLFK